MKNNLQFGETVSGYNIPVVNEREIRAAAGIMFLATLISFFLIIHNQNFVPIKYVIIIFMIDFSIRLFLTPRFSPLLILGRFFVRNQNPEYVGAPQKKFAWGIGLILSILMFLLLVLLNTYSVITGLTCFACLILMFFESAFGICIGCKMYGWIKKEKAQYCPGEVCEVNMKQDIQKVSKNQWFIFIAFIVFVVILALIFNDAFKIMPSDLLKMLKN